MPQPCNTTVQAAAEESAVEIELAAAAVVVGHLARVGRMAVAQSTLRKLMLEVCASYSFGSCICGGLFAPATVVVAQLAARIISAHPMPCM